MTAKFPRMMTRLGLPAVFCGLVIGHAWADPANGERLARRWCASCHAVASDQKQASTDVPPFSAIAGMSAFNREKLTFFLLDPHPKMPDMSLSRNEASDLADYIASLAPR